MIPAGLTSNEAKTLVATLTGSKTLKTTVRVLDLKGNYLSDISSLFAGGEVNVDGEAEVTRNVNLSFNDPGRALPFEASSPDDGALFFDHMIEVVYSVKGPNASGYIDVPVFVGPVIKLSRDDNNMVSVECQGKEYLSQGLLWTGHSTYKKGTPKTDVIIDVMRRFGGETRFSIPALPDRLPEDLTITRWSTAWQIAQNLSQSLSRQLYYDGAGVLRLRPLPDAPVFVFKQGDGGSVLSEPSVTYSITEVKNTIHVVGPKTNNNKPIVATAIAAASHPLNPVTLGRGGHGRYLVESIDNDAIRTLKEAQALANTTLDNRLMQAVEVSFDSLTIPFLDPQDKVRLETNVFGAEFRMNKYTIPLTAADAMSVGYNKRVRINKRSSRK